VERYWSTALRIGFANRLKKSLKED
jgi:hypothetical protein